MSYHEMNSQEMTELKTLSSVSSQIRFASKILYPEGNTNYYQIAKFLSIALERNVRPQHVRNVLVTPLKRS